MFERFETPVRCSAGHLFTTIWVPTVSVKSVRMSGERYQHCPVGHHWAAITRLDEAGPPPSPEDLATAAQVHDVRVP